MQLKKKCKVVMLPTEKVSYIFLTLNKKIEIIKDSEFGISSPQHLYIIDDSEIKEGDYVPLYNHDRNGEICGFKKWDGKSSLSSLSKKVIATTDILLYYTTKKQTEESHYPLPQPSPQFVEKYIEAYNAGNPIVDVMVEHETNGNWEATIASGYSGRRCVNCGTWNYLESEYNCSCGLSPKVDKDNYITITKCKPSLRELCEKDSDLKKEITNIIEKALNERDKFLNKSGTLSYNFDKWIEENL